MKKSIQSVFLAFVVLTVLLSGCAPAPTPPPLQPASAIPTTAAATATPTAPSAARATPTLAAPAVVNPVALVGLAGATRIDILAFDSAPGAGAQPGYVQRLAVTDPATVGRILAALNVDMKSLPKAACIPEYELRFQLPGGAVKKLSYNCHDSSFLRGDQPAWAEYDAEAPAAFDQLMSELLAAPTPIPPTLTPSPMPIAAPAVSRTPSASVAGAPVTVVPPSSPTQYLEFANLSDLQKLTKFPIWLPTYIPDNLPFYKVWIADYANGNQNVRLLYSEPGNSLDANLKSLDIQMTMTDEIVSSDSITHQFKVTALDVREMQVRGQTGFTYWTRSGAAGNSAYLVWREGTFNFSISLFGAWPQPDESNPHGLDNMLLTIAKSLQTAQ